MKYFDITELKQKGNTIHFDTYLSKMVLEVMQFYKRVSISLEKCCFVRIAQNDTFHPDLQLWR